MNRKYIMPLGGAEILKSLGLSISKAGAYFDTVRHSVQRDGLPEWILLYCIGGEGYVRTKEKKTVREGRAAVIPASLAHAYASNPDNPWKLYWVHFLWDSARLTLPPFSKTESTALFFNMRDPERAQRLFTALLGTLADGEESFSRQMESAGYLLSLLCLLQREEGRKTPRFSAPVRLAAEVLQNSLYRKIGLDELAERVGVSKYHLLRSFREGMGMPPMHYLSELRVREACRLLVTEGLGIEEVSERLCFHSSKYFSEVFREKMGMPPGKYRRLYGEFTAADEKTIKNSI